MPVNIIAAAVVAVGLIIAAMFARYDFHHEGLSTYRLDRLTGKVEFCGLTDRPSWCS